MPAVTPSRLVKSLPFCSGLPRWHLWSALSVVLLATLAACKEAGPASDGEGAAATGQSQPTSGSGTGSDATPRAGAGNGNATGTGNGPEVGVGVTEQVHLMGRFVPDALGQLFAWSNSQMSAKFTGTGISMTMDELSRPASYGPNMYNVSIDGKAPTPLTAVAGGGTYVLASGLPAGEHTVVVQKRTEASIGTARFRNFTVANGQLVPQPATVRRRLLVIGDSISCGYGVLGTSAQCAFSAATENAALTYGALAAQAVGADVQITAWSGKGIYRNNDGSTTATLADLFNLSLPTDANTTFDWGTFVADAIVINLGTNDFSATFGAPDAQLFASAYGRMLTTLQGAYPGAHIFLALGPMLVDNYPQGTKYLQTARTYLETIAATANAHGDAKVSLLVFDSLTDAQKGCDSHPNAVAQAGMAQTLQAALNKTLGW